MKKLFVLLAVAAFFAGGMSLQSCKKCSTCKYTYTYYGYTQTYDFPEECGSSSDIDAYEQACRDAAYLAGGS
jgi:hypothetical protein